MIAVGNAVVEFAGTDDSVQYGPQTNFYGNLVVLRLTDVVASDGRAVFALYGHLSEVFVGNGDPVPAREIIGAVGGTGVAAGGVHLHFEVRVGNPADYAASTRNPDLWIRPYFGYGTLAGRVVNASGALLPEVSITINGIDAIRYTGTYAGEINQSDPVWGENWTYGDLPEGWYTVTTRAGGKTHRAEVFVSAGRTAWVEFVVE